MIWVSDSTSFAAFVPLGFVDLLDDLGIVLCKLQNETESVGGNGGTHWLMKEKHTACFLFSDWVVLDARFQLCPHVTLPSYISSSQLNENEA
jgi:hypothetical protein